MEIINVQALEILAKADQSVDWVVASIQWILRRMHTYSDKHGSKA